jgi:hypothetical protein
MIETQVIKYVLIVGLSIINIIKEKIRKLSCHIYIKFSRVVELHKKLFIGNKLLN